MSDWISPDETAAPYVIDRNAVVWTVVHDGGMATRADYAGITTTGIVRLEQEAGPLTPFWPMAYLRSRYSDQQMSCCDPLDNPPRSPDYDEDDADDSDPEPR